MVSALRIWVALVVFAVVGAVDLRTALAARSAAVAPRETTAIGRQDRVYCLRGWRDKYSHGIDAIAQRAASQLDVQAVSSSYSEWRNLAREIIRERAPGEQGALILIGHSFGGDCQIRIAKLLNEANIKVDLMFLIDPNSPRPLPPNVHRCINIYKSNPRRDSLPFFRGVSVRARDPSRTEVQNIDLRTSDLGFETAAIDHFNITDVKAIQDAALAEIAKLCRRRRI